MKSVALTIVLLTLSNVFMTFAWYAHLKTLNHKPWIAAALISWGIALFEYLLQVPANRIGYTVLSLGQLKILQEGGGSELSGGQVVTEQGSARGSAKGKRKAKAR